MDKTPRKTGSEFSEGQEAAEAGMRRADARHDLGAMQGRIVRWYWCHLRRIQLSAIGIVLLFALVFPILTSSSFIVYFAASAITTLILVLSLNIVMSYAGIISLVHTGLFGLGAYFVGIFAVKLGMDPWLGLVAAVVGTTIFGSIVAAVGLRTTYLYFAMITFTFNLIILGVVSNWKSVTGGLSGIVAIPRFSIGSYNFSDTDFYYLSLLVFILSFIGIRNVINSRYGRAWVALRESHDSAASLGIAPYRYLLLAFAFCSAWAGLAGGLFGSLTGFVSPMVAEFINSLILFIGILLGGVGSMAGPMMSAGGMKIVEHYVARWAELQVIIFAGILLGAMMIIPRGIVGTWQRSRFGRESLPLPEPPPDGERFTGDGAAVLTEWEHRRGGQADAANEEVPAMEVEGVTKRFGGVVALSEVSMTVRAGTIHGLIGPNGSGKSTLVNVVSGFLEKDGGRVLLFGREAPSTGHKAAREGLVRIFQTPHIFTRLTVLENVMVGFHLDSSQSFFSSMFRLPAFRRDERAVRSKALEILGAAGLKHLADRSAATLSHGQQRMLEVARTLGAQPRILVLDEPATGLTGEEVVALSYLIRRIKEAGVTVLLIEHNMPFVMGVCEYVTALDEGQLVVEGTPEECQRSEQLLAVYLGEEV